MYDGPRLQALKRTTYLLIRAGFQSRHLGYRYLREAVWISCKEPEVLDSVTKRLYPEVARRFGTTCNHVERAIRNTIELAWLEGNEETLKAIFGDLFSKESERPTNSAVIRALADNIFNGGCDNQGGFL